MSVSHLLKGTTSNLMIYRPGPKAEYLQVNNSKLSAEKRVEGQNGVFIVNFFLNHQSKQVCAIVHKRTGLCITSNQNDEYNIQFTDQIADLDDKLIKLEPNDDRFFFFTEINGSWLFKAENKPDTYLTIEDGKALLVQAKDPENDSPGAFLKILNADNHPDTIY
ncbi:uncharacterized protein LOC117100764 [Anneissia japonica]|uniref:uncharacterized protein LOC117100764 n=1 Tax=Anneissia japonica TaxID=1529436 RepID=UPI001425BB0F|nr:uncharacterized protein LOC117100764 [Anneissia japonica]